MSIRKRQSTVAKLSRKAYYAMIQFAKLNNCGFIVRHKGVEYGCRLSIHGHLIFDDVGIDPEVSRLIGIATIRKGWESGDDLAIPCDDCGEVAQFGHRGHALCADCYADSYPDSIDQPHYADDLWSNYGIVV